LEASMSCDFGETLEVPFDLAIQHVTDALA
jgi:hypothetical protein